MPNQCSQAVLEEKAVFWVTLNGKKACPNLHNPYLYCIYLPIKTYMYSGSNSSKERKGRQGKPTMQSQ